MTPTLAEITRELLASYNRQPRKRLGQHFLIDPLVLQRIVHSADIKKDDLVVEIGSGLGVLTSELAKAAGEVIAIEIDKELVRICKDLLKNYSNIRYVDQDILKIDLNKLVQGNSYKIIANLPYYITAPIIEKILTSPIKPELSVLMMQKEVAERISAKPGGKQYGSFSIFVQYYAEVELSSFVSKSSFLPWPEVSSAIVILKPYSTPKYRPKDEKLFFKLVRSAFQQRRKKIRNSLKAFKLDGKGFDLNRRPETLGIDEFVQIADSLTPST